MRAVTLLCGLVLCLMPACGEQDEPSPDRLALIEAVRLQNGAKYLDAMDAYERIIRTSSDRQIVAKAELGRAQIESALQRKKQAIQTISGLINKVEPESLASIEGQINGIVDEFAGTSFEQEISDEAAAALRAARSEAARLRQVQSEAVRNLIKLGEYTSALELLRTLESRRSIDDRRDIAELLVEVRMQSEKEADELLAAFQARTEQDKEGAVSVLDRQMVRFRGTRAHARLLEARLRVNPELPKPTRAPEPGGEEEGGG